MGIFDLRGNSGSSNSWNYADSSKPHYSLRLNGTVIEIANPQKINFVTKQPETWPDGNPKRNLRLTLVDAGGVEWTWTFAPRSIAANACLVALDPSGTRPQVSIEELLGKLIDIRTEEGVYNQQHPRPWQVQVIGDGQVNLVRGLKDLSKGEAPAPAPQSSPVATVNQAMQTPTGQRAVQAAAAAGYAPAQQAVQGNAYSMYDADIPF